MYGDVKESEVNKPSLLRQKLGLGLIEDKAASSEKSVVEIKSGLMKPVEVKAELMKASG